MTLPAARAPDAAALARWQAEGVLVLPGFKAPAEVQALAGQARALCSALAGDGAAAGEGAVFSTTDRARLGDAALLASAEGVRAFFEEDAVDAQGRLQRPPAAAINKIGHALHEHDPVARAFSRGPALAALAAALGVARPRVWQSQLIFKQPGIGGAVAWHQDGSFFQAAPAEPPLGGVLTLWFALEDATRDNGCLWVAPGQQGAPLRERFVRRADPAAPAGVRLAMEPLDATPWPADADAVPLEVEAGTLVCFGGRMPHRSDANRSPRSRLAYTLHLTDAGSAYSPLNWLQRTQPAPGFVD